MSPLTLTYRPASSSCLHSGGGERMTADEERLAGFGYGSEKIYFYRQKTL